MFGKHSPQPARWREADNPNRVTSPHSLPVLEFSVPLGLCGEDDLKPQHLLAEFKVGQQWLGGAFVRHRAAIEHVGAVGQR